MVRLVGHFFASDLLPQYLSALTIEAEDDELISLCGRRSASEASAAAWASALLIGWRGRWGCRCCRPLFACWNGRLNKDAIAPDDGRAGAGAWDLKLPANVVRLAPCRRWIGRGCDSVGQRPAPF